MRLDKVYKKLSSISSKTFVSENGVAVITCPNCGLTKQVPMAGYSGKRNRIKVRCRCHQIFSVELEFRQTHRKQTNLHGFYEIISTKGGGRAAIEDLSKNGMGFRVSGVHNVRVGQKIMVGFSLDDQKNTPLKKMAVVRSVDDNRIGCAFRKDQAFEKELGFYLRS